LLDYVKHGSPAAAVAALSYTFTVMCYCNKCFNIDCLDRTPKSAVLDT